MHQTRLNWLTRTAILMAVALVFQLGGFPQLITGPLVNMVLYLAAIFVGWQGGVLIGIFTPIIAAMRGILPPPLNPLIPFIALSNGVLVILFFWLKSRQQVLGVLIASAVKFFILFTAVNLFVQVPPPVAKVMSFPQLITALIGGFVALLVYRTLKKTGFDIE